MYRWVYVYAEDGSFLGYSIKQDGAKNLQTHLLWIEADEAKLYEQVDRLNESEAIKAAWPDARDPDVRALLDDPLWEPVEVGPVEVVDEDQTQYFYVERQATDRMGEPLFEEDGSPIMEREIDLANTVLIYKTIMAPLRPGDVGRRVRQAQETVARRRVA